MILILSEVAHPRDAGGHRGARRPAGRLHQDALTRSGGHARADGRAQGRQRQRKWDKLNKHHASCAGSRRPGDRRPCAPCSHRPSTRCATATRSTRSPWSNPATLRRCCRATGESQTIELLRQPYWLLHEGHRRGAGYARQCGNPSWLKDRLTARLPRVADGQIDAWENAGASTASSKTTAASTTWTGAMGLHPRRHADPAAGAALGSSRTRKPGTPCDHQPRASCLFLHGTGGRRIAFRLHAGCGPPKGRHRRQRTTCTTATAESSYRKERPVDCDPWDLPPHVSFPPARARTAGRPAPAVPSGWEDASAWGGNSAPRRALAPPCPSAASRSSNNPAPPRTGRRMSRSVLMREPHSQ